MSLLERIVGTKALSNILLDSVRCFGDEHMTHEVMTDRIVLNRILKLQFPESRGQIKNGAGMKL